MYTKHQFLKKTGTINGLVGVDMKFERIRRITGYLVGTVDRFNNAKRSEVMDRVKHNCGCRKE